MHVYILLNEYLIKELAQVAPRNRNCQINKSYIGKGIHKHRFLFLYKKKQRIYFIYDQIKLF